ncbi:hypothetical protein Tco_1182704 [Tanacetum coccineum]
MVEVLISSLDAGNPLFLYANDHSNLSIVGFKLTSVGLALQWERCNAIVLGWIRRSNLLAREPLPDVKDAFVVVSREESYRGLAPGKLSAKIHVAFVSNGNNNNFNIRVNTDNNNNRGLNPNLAVCFVKKFNGNADVSQTASTSSGSMSGNFRNEQMMKLLSLINEKHAANVSGSMAVDISSLRLTVGHHNGTMATITPIGSLKLTENVVLFDVLVVPEYIVSLLSVNKMIKDNRYFVGFNGSKCYIQDLK